MERFAFSEVGLKPPLGLGHAEACGVKWFASCAHECGGSIGGGSIHGAFLVRSVSVESMDGAWVDGSSDGVVKPTFIGSAGPTVRGLSAPSCCRCAGAGP
eukprot:2173841-Pleurochrysis_carterae.AAC.2